MSVSEKQYVAEDYHFNIARPINVNPVHDELSKRLLQVETHLTQNVIVYTDLSAFVAEPDWASRFWIGDGSFEFDANNTELSLFAATKKSDPKADELHPEAKELYLKANTAYLKDPGHVYPYIIINSGRRDVYNQAKLYTAYIEHLYGGSAAPKANKPGASNHEYGLAIDVIRRDDEERLRKALIDAGWTNDVADEGWHFDATGIPSWNKLQETRKKNKEQYSDPYGEMLATYYELRKRRTEEYLKMMTESNRLGAENSRLVEVQASLETRLRNLKATYQNLRRRADAYNRDLDDLNQLGRKIDKFQYTYCPNGQTFKDCNHTKEKRRYVDEYNALTDRYNRILDDLERRYATLDRDFQRYERDATRYEQDVKDYNADYAKYQSELEALFKAKERYIQWGDRMSDLQDKIPKALDEIAKIVKASTS